MSNEPLHLIVRYLSNEATAEEQEELLDWVSTSANNQKTFHQYAATWNREEMRLPVLNTGRAAQVFNDRIDATERGSEKRSSPLWLKVAAAITVFAVCSIFVWYIFRAYKTTEYAQTSTRAGERLEIRLSDGTSVQLNAHSTLRYPVKFKGNAREVLLSGEAFFKVTPNHQLPFIVHTERVSTEVLGTSFNVDTDSTEVAVTVASGKVKVSNGARQEILLPGDKVQVSRKSGLIKRSQVDINLVLAWTRSTLVFNNATLADVARNVEAWYGIKVLLDNEHIAQCRITGTYKHESLMHVLAAIKFSTGVQFHTKADGTIVLFGDGCE